MKVGERTKGFVNKVRPDGKVDIILHKPGYEKTVDISTSILNKLNSSGGFLSVNDKSEADIIYQMFGVSKKTFKKAIGALYKSRRIKIEQKGIRIV